ncbi:MAG TPA: hypothetical protein VHE55_05805 [Fimbriimonadaceae bacterium]|nr:hypothetical protein [Fimbriimonadaceae bacterium]
MLLILEVPLESLVGFFVPFLGFAADAVFDGLEFLVFPILLSAMILPHLVPKSRPA